ncbi:hypothetical protein TNIN_224941 [Trichonephila inaurata madagascariensis]|uniref:Integrase catalytic domain-containing protein n=1 Tax=Trichonephila inaurata madagascariensis TaxID=2747483 RepID=A0A8X6YJ68_9ARAC|nr:hypothetical protein TNIN_224941 [Trichonephila inaurata madagascariensis]
MAGGHSASGYSAEAVAKASTTQLISRFGVPAIITTDHEASSSLVFYSLKQMLGITNSNHLHHPSSNGMVERSSYPQASFHSVSRYKMDRVATGGPAGRARACIKE